MEKRIKYIETIIISVLISSLITCGVFLLFSKLNKSVTEEKVTVTDEGISAGVNNVYDAVVAISAYKNNIVQSIGTGFVYNKENNLGYIMTNHHVISEGEKITVKFSNGKEVEAKLIGSDEYADIAVLTVDSENILKVANIGSSKSAKLGDTIFTIGTPVSLEYSGTVTRGILSGKNRLVDVAVNGYTYDWSMNVMQIDAAINPGNSGGPLCNANGDVIGINSLKIVQEEVEGLGFSIPIEDALEYAQELIKEGKIKRPYLGISMIPVASKKQLEPSGIRIDSSLTEGVIIAEILEDGVAKKSGLQVGDVIIRINNDETPTLAKFRYYLYKYSSGELINIIVNRNGVETAIKVTID